MSTVQGTTTGQDIGQQLNKVLQAQAAAAGGAKAAGAEKVTADGTEDRFLKLLVAQMRNQDPLNPMDNAQVTTQMAQISTVRGIETLNDSMSALVANLGRGSPLEALGLIGRQVLAAGSTIERLSDADGAVRAGFELPSAADAVRAQVVDAAGNVVYSRDWGKTAAGMQTFEWDGRTSQGTPAPAGTYRLRVGAVTDGQPSAVTALAPGRVLGVTPGADGVRIELSGQRSIAADAIKAIL